MDTSRIEKLEEYKLIRDEILQALDTVRNYKNLLYTTTAAILAFAFTKDNPLMFLIPYIVIIPLSIIEQNQISSCLRMGAYLKVFCENNINISWESNLVKYDEVYVTKIEHPAINQYILISIYCSLLALTKLDFRDILSVGVILNIVLILSITILSIFIVRKNQINYLDKKREYLKRWEYIKEINI